MDLGLVAARTPIPDAPAPAVILLDTNALIWLLQGHKRGRPLHGQPRLHMSPASLLELQLLLESGRLALRGRRLIEVSVDPRWRLDEPPAGRWFDLASEVGWTRDPFDRLVVAHARTRGWVLATGDTRLLSHLRPSEVLPL